MVPWRQVEEAVSVTLSVFVLWFDLMVNKMMHLLCDNKTEQGFLLVNWNIGANLLENKITEIQTYLAESQPHMLGIIEVNLRQGVIFWRYRWMATHL